MTNFDTLMAKLPSKKLFRLIKSLTGAEKRYFRIFVRGRTEKDSNYMVLFRLIDKAKKFDDAAFKTVLYPNGVESKKYSELKAYLYDLILQCLGAFDHKSSVDFRLNQYLQNVLVLYKRGVYADCLDQLSKAKRLSKRYERLPFQLDLLKWEKQIAYARIDVDFLTKELQRLAYEEKKLLDEISNTAFYRRAFYEVLAIVKKEAAVRGEDRIAQLQHIIEKRGFKDSDSALTHTGRIYYYRTKSLYYYSAVQYDNFYASGKMLIELLESQPHFLKDSLADYIAALSNFILSCGLLRKYAEVQETLDKLWEIEPITLDDRLKIHRQYFTNKFVLCIFTGEFEEGKREMERHQQVTAKLPIEEQETASFYFQYFSICFGCADFDQALDWLNQWLSQPRTTDREDLQSLARILELIIHVEMENYLLCESLLRSATRYIARKERLFTLERRFIECINELLKVTDTKAYKAPIQAMKNDLEQISQAPEAKVLLQTFDLEAWLDSKLVEKTFAEIVRAKAFV